MSTFAYDGAGRSMLEFDPATVFAFSTEGREPMSVAVNEASVENVPHGPLDLAAIMDRRLRQMAASPVVKDGAPRKTRLPGSRPPT
jgi:hypothetical protein